MDEKVNIFLFAEFNHMHFNHNSVAMAANVSFISSFKFCERKSVPVCCLSTLSHISYNNNSINLSDLLTL